MTCPLRGHGRDALVALFVLSAFLGGPAVASEIIKCVAKDGLPLYQNFPCNIDSLGLPSTPPNAKTPAVTAKPVGAALFASAFKLVSTVMAANGADSFALVRRTADSQLVQLRAGDRVEGLTVSAIEPDRVVLAGAAHAIVIEADRAAAVSASPVPSRAVGPPPASQEEPAWAGDPAPFGH
jgi:hypothetical protein